MAVLERYRPKSRFKVLDFAVWMRKELTNDLLRDFGYKPRDYELPKNFNDLPDEQKEKVLERALKKRDRQDGLEAWFLEKSRDVIIDALINIIKHIELANTMYIVTMDDYRERRANQNRAIGYCGILIQELQYVIETLPVNVNLYTEYEEVIKVEINLLKGWRKSDNKYKVKLEKGKL